MRIATRISLGTHVHRKENAQHPLGARKAFLKILVSCQVTALQAEFKSLVETDSVRFVATPLLHIHINVVRSGERFAIRHLDLRECLAVHGLVFLDDAVLKQNESSKGINLIRVERSGSKHGHLDRDGIRLSYERTKWSSL